jgi:hypothetical protein
MWKVLRVSACVLLALPARNLSSPFHQLDFIVKVNVLLIPLKLGSRQLAAAAQDGSCTSIKFSSFSLVPSK